MSPKIRLMKSANVELNASNLPEAYLKIPVSQKVMLELNDKPLTDENRNRLNKMIINFLYECTPKEDNECMANESNGGNEK